MSLTRITFTFYGVEFGFNPLIPLLGGIVISALAAFLGVGAYTQAILTNAGWPFPLAMLCAAVLAAAVGVVVGLPALRVKGIYLGIATLAFGFIVEEVLARWESRHDRPCRVQWQDWRLVFEGKAYGPSTSCYEDWESGLWKDWKPTGKERSV